MNSETTPITQPVASSTDPLAGRVVDEFASVGVLTVTPDAPLEEVAWLMANNRVHAVVVVTDDQSEPPVITDADLVAAASSGHFDRLCAADIAGTEAVSVRGDETLSRAAQLLAEQGISHLVVRDRRRMPVGILSNLDLARAISGRS